MPYTLENPYITITELAEQLGEDIPEADSEAEDLYKRAIWQASRWVDNWTGEDFFKHDFTVNPIEIDQFSRGVYREKIFLKHRPIIALTQVLQGGVELVEDTDFVVNYEEGQLYKMPGQWNPRRPDALIQIYGSAGYPQSASTAVPTGLPGKVVTSTRLVAAVISGKDRREFYGLDGTPTEIAMTEIPKQVFQMLGKQMPILT